MWSFPLFFCSVPFLHMVSEPNAWSFHFWRKPFHRVESTIRSLETSALCILQLQLWTQQIHSIVANLFSFLPDLHNLNTDLFGNFTDSPRSIRQEDSAESVLLSRQCKASTACHSPANNVWNLNLSRPALRSFSSWFTRSSASPKAFYTPQASNLKPSMPVKGPFTRHRRVGWILLR